MPINLSIDDELTYYGVPYIVHSISPPYIGILRLDGDKKVRNIDYIQLMSDPNFVVSNKLKKRAAKENEKEEMKYKTYYDNLSDLQKEKVMRRYEIIKPILLYEKVKEGEFIASIIFKESYSHLIPNDEETLRFSKNTLIKKIAEREEISTRQIKRYLASFKEYEMAQPTNGKDGLVSKTITEPVIRSDEQIIEISHPKRKDVILDSITVRLDKEYIPIIKKTIEKKYLNKIRPNISSLKDVIEVECYKEGLKPLSYDTVYSIVNRLNKQVVNVLRIGDDALEDLRLNERGFYKNAKAPLHIIEIDHTLLDIDVIDEKSGANMGRPWITLGIDVYTRMIWCMHISFDSPSATKVRKAIEHGLFFKNSKVNHNTINEWEICGIPQIIYVDNGSDFKSFEIKRLVNEGLNIQIMYRPIKLPRYGAVIERVFGTINKSFIHNLSGTRKSNTIDLGEYDAEEDAIFTLDNIRELLNSYIVDVYHHSIHKGLPLEYPTPTVMYYRGMEIFGFPEFISKEEEWYYKLKLMSEDKRKYGKDGIRKDNVIYNSKETAVLITKPPTTYRIKYDPDDISFIYVLNPKTHEYIKVYAQNPPVDEIKGMNRVSYSKILQVLRSQGKINIQQIPGSRDIGAGKKHLTEKIDKMMKKNKRARKEAIKSGLNLTIDTRETKKKSDISANDITQSLIEQLDYERSKGDV